jgi:hypothetical protein
MERSRVLARILPQKHKTCFLVTMIEAICSAHASKRQLALHKDFVAA